MTKKHALKEVKPLRPAAPYVGGKRMLASTLVAKIATIPHNVYAEPFVGMGGVFLRRPFAAKSEIINDLSGDVTNFFRILQRHYVAFMDELKFKFTSRADFDRLMATDPSTLTDLERAARFLYLQRTAFGGKVAGRTFGISPGNPGRFDVTKLAELLTALSDRLAAVIIENLDCFEFVARYDRADALFYLDPPYLGSEHYYGPGMFGRPQLERLAEVLGKIRGRFILTINDVPATRAIFSAFKIEAAEVTYSISEAPPRRSGELIVSDRR
jgi:DNA adenine methylase